MGKVAHLPFEVVALVDDVAGEVFLAVVLSDVAVLEVVELFVKLHIVIDGLLTVLVAHIRVFEDTVEVVLRHEALKKQVFKSDYCQADETTTPVMDKHKASKEYLWMVRAVMERLVFFHYDNGSSAGAVIEFLARENMFKGYLQCDGFAGYESAFKTSLDVSLVNCMAHIRRKFEYALEQDKTNSEYALSKIQQLYRIEKECDKGELSAEERKERRQKEAKPIMVETKGWLEQIAMKYGSSTLLGKAAGYAYVRWDNMMRYLDDGRIKIDNNLAENEMRPITLGRKNYLFYGNHEAAENMCVISSLPSTCRNHDVKPREYVGSTDFVRG